MFDLIKKPMVIIAIGAGITLLGGAITLIGTYLQNKSSSEKSTRIEFGVNEGVTIGKNTSSNVDLLKNQNTELIKKSEKQSNTIDKLREENMSLYDKLMEANNVISDNIRGGEEMIYLEQREVDKNFHELFIVNNNTNPIYGATIYITDYFKVIYCKSRQIDVNEYEFDTQCYLNYTSMIKANEIAIHEVSLVYLNSSEAVCRLLDKDHGAYQIRFRLRSKMYIQQYYFQKVDGKVKAASRVFEVVSKPNEKSKVKLLNTFDLGLGEIDLDKVFVKGIIDVLTPL
ncbi:hypothetical protein [Fibrella forsythiae]|uniref:Uncharacterized protein n=1 Tax=Fibrella forsythiae TaxID=2817061 RepID=A0ABS3JAJ0_9BACT|nr:hypothetical protein [Fibrella forsythiae]MBO0947017.1 hypothetical protein [Fibrella forsythiae]